MPNPIVFGLAVAALFSAPAFAQDSLEAPAGTELSTQFGLSYTDSLTLNDDGSTLILDDVKTLDFGYRAEREFARNNTLSLSGALSAQASIGEGNASEFNGLSQSGDADFRRLGAYADIIARLERQNETDWTPFVSAGTGIVYDRAEFNDRKFQDLSPVGRVRAGLEKELNSSTTIGMSVGKSFKLD